MTPAEQRRQLLRWAAAAGLVPAAGLLLAEPGRQASGSAARPAPVLPGGASAAELPQHKPVPGGVALVPLGAAVQPPNAKLNGHAALIWGDTTQWTAVVGLLLSTPSAGVDLLVSDGLGAEAQRTIRIAVKPAHYAEQRLTVAPGTVDLSKENLARHERERKHLGEVMATRSATLPTKLRMRVPVPGPRSSSFGLRRIFNGQARSPHNGMDIAAPTGTPIACPLAGRVIDTGDYFFSGRSVWLDHGSGLLTFYCHLDSISCQTGQSLGLGDNLGAVGATGRVTGPHLHWSVMLNRAYVDPALFIPG